MVKNPPANTGDIERCEFNLWVRKIPWRRACQPTPAFFPGKSHGQRSLVGYSPWGHKESDIAEHACTSKYIFQSHTILDPSFGSAI